MPKVLSSKSSNKNHTTTTAGYSELEAVSRGAKDLDTQREDMQYAEMEGYDSDSGVDPDPLDASADMVELLNRRYVYIMTAALNSR